MFDPQQLKAEFPILSRQVNGKPLVYLDNAATSQKPNKVIDAISNYYRTSNANVHRGVHSLSDESTQAWEESRVTVARFFGAEPDELIVTRNTTEALNGVAYGWADTNLKAGDIILTTPMEHHSNLVVWQQVCSRTGAELQYLELNVDGTLVLEQLESWVANPKLRLVALVHVSNALGTRNPVEDVAARIKRERSDVRIVVDGAQSAPHIPIQFRSLGVDFFSFSGHKMLGPMGVGGLLVRSELLESGEFQPWLFGGGMIATVDRSTTTFAESQADRFTAGTPDVAGLVGLAAACEYLQGLRMSEVEAHDAQLVSYALERLQTVPGLSIVGPQDPSQRVGSVACIYSSVHAHDVAQVLDSEGVAVRSGHHCTMPLHTHFQWQATIRASFQVYNTVQDIDALVTAFAKVQQIFGK